MATQKSKIDREEVEDFLPLHVNMSCDNPLPPTSKKSWKDDGVNVGSGINDIWLTYPNCAYCTKHQERPNLIKDNLCTHPERKWKYCGTHTLVGQHGNTDCPLNGMEE